MPTLPQAFNRMTVRRHCSTVGGNYAPIQVLGRSVLFALCLAEHVAIAAYNGLQVSLRHSMSSGLQFDLNYTFSKSIDVGSNAERVNGFESGSASPARSSMPGHRIIWRAVSDFDTTHQFNANWVWNVPFGHGRHWGGGANKIVNGISEDGASNGLCHWTSGFPFTVNAGAGWSTNWRTVRATSFLTGPKSGKTGVFRDSNGDPTVFKDPRTSSALADRVRWQVQNFRATLPGESGQRNIFAGPAISGWIWALLKPGTSVKRSCCASHGKFSTLPTPSALMLLGSLINQDLVDITGFGKYNQTLTSPRVMQFSLRFGF